MFTIWFREAPSRKNGWNPDAWKKWGAESTRDNAVSEAWSLEDECGIGNVIVLDPLGKLVP